METYKFSHLAAETLLHDVTMGAVGDRRTLAVRLAQMSEVDARRLYAPPGYKSMKEFCMKELGFCEQAALKRIRVARMGRRFPMIFPAVADGRLHLTAVVMLASHLTEENVEELVAAAARKSADEIAHLLARMFPKPYVPTGVRAIAPSPMQLAVRPVEGPQGEVSLRTLVDEPQTPGHSESPVPRSKVAPLAPERYEVQFTMDQEMHDDLRYLQELLSHQVPSGDVGEVTRRSYKVMIAKLEKAKFGATDKPRRSRLRKSSNARYVPAEVRRAVTRRDGGQCTFVSESGQRCSARKFLEFDHVQEVARGGRSTVDNIRLRCRAHNQYTAECAFGAPFMEQRREDARRDAAVNRERRAAEERRRAAAEEQTKDVIKGLQNLGFPARDARRAAEFSETIPDASLEERMRAALSYFRPRGTYVGHAAPA